MLLVNAVACYGPMYGAALIQSSVHNPQGSGLVEYMVRQSQVCIHLVCFLICHCRALGVNAHGRKDGEHSVCAKKDAPDDGASLHNHQDFLAHDAT